MPSLEPESVAATGPTAPAAVMRFVKEAPTR